MRFPNVEGASSYEYALRSETHNVEFTPFQGILENGFITIIVPDLEEGVLYDLEIRVASPWIGNPVKIPVAGGRIVYIIDFRAGQHTLYQFHSGYGDGQNAARLKRFLLPSAIVEPGGVAVRSNGDVYLLDQRNSGANKLKLYAFSASHIEGLADNGTLTPTRSHDLLSSTSNALVGDIDFIGDTLCMYSTNSADGWSGFSATEIPTTGSAPLSLPTYHASLESNSNVARYGFSVYRDAGYNWGTDRQDSMRKLFLYDRELESNANINPSTSFVIVDRTGTNIGSSSTEGLEFIDNELYLLHINPGGGRPGGELKRYMVLEGNYMEDWSIHIPTGLGNPRYLSFA